MAEIDLSKKIKEIRYISDKLRSPACKKLINSENSIDKCLNDKSKSDQEKINSINKISKLYDECPLANIFLKLTTNKSKIALDLVADFN